MFGKYRGFTIKIKIFCDYLFIQQYDSKTILNVEMTLASMGRAA